VESEDDLSASPSNWKMDIDRMPGRVRVSKDDLPTFTIKTRARSASNAIANVPEELMATDREEYQLDSSPTNSHTNIVRQSHGTKRKAMSDPPKALSRSSSNQVMEVLIMVPSPKKKRLTSNSSA